MDARARLSNTGYIQSNITVENDVPVIALEAIDHLVLIAVLLCSVGISLNGTFNNKKRNDSESAPSEVESTESNLPSDIPNGNPVVQPEETISSIANHRRMFSLMFTAITSIIPFFVNTLSLFSLSGEIYANDTSVVFFVVGLLISVALIAVSGISSILATANISTVASYLKKRYNTKTATHLVSSSAIVRHILGGALNVHVASLAAGAASGISGTAIALTISASAAFCVTVGGVQSEKSYSIGSMWLAILSITSFVVLCIATSDIGGVSILIMKARMQRKISWPSLLPFPWELHSYWGTTILGIIVGFQIFLMARASLKHLVVLRPTYYYISLIVVCFINVLWVALATWAGLCASVTFSELWKNNHASKPPIADGSLAVLISLKMYYVKGFRGFFLGSMIAASISGLTRRFNQMIAVVWETWNDIRGKSASTTDRAFSEDLGRLRNRGATDEFIREMVWSYEKKKSCSSFLFKTPSGLAAGLICIGVLWVLQECNLGSWALWQGIIGVINGSILGALFLGLFFPCLPHRSVVLGLLIGWCIPCCLILGNIYLYYHPQSGLGLNGDRYIEKTTHKDLPIFLNTDDKESNISQKIIFNEEFFLEERQWQIIGGQPVEIVLNKDIKENDPFIARRYEMFLKKRKYLWHTSYCYYGLLGLLSCMVSAILVTASTYGINRCNQKEFPPELVHPLVHVFLLRPSTTSEDSVTQKSGEKLTAFAAFQEKAGF